MKKASFVFGGICIALILMMIFFTKHFWLLFPPREGTEFHPAAYPNSTWVSDEPYIRVCVDAQRRISGIMEVNGKHIAVDLRFSNDSVSIYDASSRAVLVYGLVEAPSEGRLEIKLKRHSSAYGERKTDIFNGAYKEIFLIMQGEG